MGRGVLHEARRNKKGCDETRQDKTRQGETNDDGTGRTVRYF